MSAPLEVKPAVERALQMARARLGYGDAASRRELGDAPLVRIPSTRITQIVLNLLLNAADALAARPWSANLVEVRLETAEDRAIIEVRDNGPGLSPELRRHLFEPGRSDKSGGTSLGLGLAISRQLARLSGGDITVTCPPGAGTVFRVVAPAPRGRRRPGDLRLSQGLPSPRPSPASGRGRKSDPVPSPIGRGLG